MQKAIRYLRDNPVFSVFLLAALVSRLVFWLYTGRTWEDALITLTSARNAWEGYGLTHHISEPRVQSFTSAASILAPLIGEAVGQGLAFQKLVSLFAVIPALYYANEIGRRLGFSTGALIMVLGYLALDQHHIFFGMAGMETQVVVAVALANAHYLLASRWWRLGFASGAGMLCRPEFVFWLPIVGLTVLLIDWRQVPKVVLGTLLVGGPWFLFATLYYGSPVPHTIVAKSQSFQIVTGSFGWLAPLEYVLQWWRHFAPFWQMTFIDKAPLPDYVLLPIVSVVIVLCLMGLVRAAREDKRVLAIAGFGIVFLIYRASALVPAYYMWYLPPFTAIGAVMAGYGASWLSQRTSLVLGSALAFAYAMHIPFSFPIEKEWQTQIEDSVRTPIGLALNEMMGPNNTVSLEPLGYIGWFARNKTTYDFPGLGSPIAVAAQRGMKPTGTLEGIVDALRPTYVVMRPAELTLLAERFPQALAAYAEIRRFGGPKPPLSRWGLHYSTGDNLFILLKRR
ncbi:hypothetical protein E8L99_16240 [Phreatobacter aquaticus]|uniref:Glycosyltransferase RgtA/B/C/D-like domain-containing protein n=1 Tax=Phreatobacter aquaticus TaxID=2570229 RepID=A0A4D7QNS2_9HYPH|nr:hypothetical protein [Phreatobacter aquaticus]QCK87196.1 hypothetical protein E8L99_16240 [Phreatobacter aquaticus]